MTGDLFHVTKARNARLIAREGIRRDATRRTMQPMEMEGAADDPMAREPADVRADRELDELLASAQRSAGKGEFPDHDSGVFFWTTERRARGVARNNRARDEMVVAVDSDHIPCDCAVGDITIANSIWNELYDLYRDHGDGTMAREMFDDAERYWEAVHWYSGEEGSDLEVWCPCDAPLRAIEYVLDVERDTRLYEPTEWPTLFEFVNDD